MFVCFIFLKCYNLSKYVLFFCVVGGYLLDLLCLYVRLLYKNYLKNSLMMVKDFKIRVR